MDTLQLITEPTRRQILRLIWDRELRSGEVANAFDVSFGAVSQHLALLREAGFVNMRKDGNRRLYRADKKALGPLGAVLQSMWSTSLDSLVATVEADAAKRRPR